MWCMLARCTVLHLYMPYAIYIYYTYICVIVCFRRVSSYVPKNCHGLVVRCNAMGWFLIFIEIHARPTFQNVQMSDHNLSLSSKDCELDSDPLVLNKP